MVYLTLNSYSEAMLEISREYCDKTVSNEQGASYLIQGYL